MKIDYLVSTMVFWWREHHLSFELECDFLKSLGYGIEIWPYIRGHNECRFNKRNWPRLKDATSGMTVALHGRTDGPTINEWKEQIQCAKILEAPITAHLESLCISDTLEVADWDFVNEVVKIAKDNDVLLCVETGKLSTVLELGNKYESIAFSFNTGHANIDKKNSFEQYVDQLAPRIKHLHLTDNYGEIDDHQLPGVTGGMAKEKWEYLLEGLKKFDNHILAAFEMYPAMPGVLIKKAGEFIFKTMNWPNQPVKAEDYQDHHYRPM